jgi:RNA polymerase sigma-70 factor (ECF subfamily)
VAAGDSISEELLRRAQQGDLEAIDSLLGAQRARLRQMVAVHLDPRLAPRIDASDVVQETLMEATRRLPEYAENRPLPLYLWLRQLAWQRLIDLYRHHVRTRRRSVSREETDCMPLADHSAMSLAQCLIASGTAPSGRLRRAEEKDRVHAALNRLAPADREVLVLRYLEQLSTAETAVILGISEAGVRHRHRCALERLARLLGDPAEDRR